MGIRNCYSNNLFYKFHKFLWIISEGLCDINFKDTVYLYYFVLKLVSFFVNIVNNLKLNSGGSMLIRQHIALIFNLDLRFMEFCLLFLIF